jgi:hypothetical protein
MTTEVSRNIFVFGSNLAGRHRKGSALEARKHHGAVSGKGVGLWGNSYAIPTKDSYLRVLTLPAIQIFVTQFLSFARQHPELTFNVVAIGCGLAGYKPAQIAPMFLAAPGNVKLPPEFNAVLLR